MTLGFPNMGNLTTILCAFMRNIGGQFVGPLPTTEHTAALGVKYAPQDACMPMKIVLGNFLEAYAHGADTALFFGGKGPCCFGYFAETFQLIFRKNGIPMRVIALENNAQGVREAMQLLTAVGKKSLRYDASLLPLGIKCADMLDRYEQAVYDKQAEITDPAEKKQTAYIPLGIGAKNEGCGFSARALCIGKTGDSCPVGLSKRYCAANQNRRSRRYLFCD